MHLPICRRATTKSQKSCPRAGMSRLRLTSDKRPPSSRGRQAVQDFANFSTSNGSIQGTIWNDNNANGIRETDLMTGEFTEPGLEGWTVYLDLNNNLAFDSGEPTDTHGRGWQLFLHQLGGG